MYRIEKRFTFAGGHRLSKHKGRCYSFHGHNYVVLVGIKAEKLNDNDMVMDFSDLKHYTNEIIDSLDHCMLVNSCDMNDMKPFIDRGMRVIGIGSDPTAEKISELIFHRLVEKFNLVFSNIEVDYVTVYENESSKATYSRN